MYPYSTKYIVDTLNIECSIMENTFYYVDMFMPSNIFRSLELL